MPGRGGLSGVRWRGRRRRGSGCVEGVCRLAVAVDSVGREGARDDPSRHGVVFGHELGAQVLSPKRYFKNINRKYVSIGSSSSRSTSASSPGDTRIPAAAATRTGRRSTYRNLKPTSG